MNTLDLPESVRRVIEAVPSAGGGVNNWLYRAALALHNHWDPDAISEFLRSKTANCGRRVKSGEIERAIRRSGDIAWTPANPRPDNWEPTFEAQLRRVPLNHDAFNKATHDSINLVDLWEASPWQDQIPDDIMEILFPGNPWLCCGKANHAFATRRRDFWNGRWHKCQFMVPSPMLCQTGLTQDGRESEHTLSNTGNRRYLVIEFDQGSPDTQAALHWHLRERAPLVMAVHSGGKSLHGWYFVEGVPEEHLKRFMRYAASLGADPATWNRSQFVRVPGGYRDNGKEQAAYYFHPYLIEKCHAQLSK